MARVKWHILKSCIEDLGLALATHGHQWTPHERKLWEQSWVEIRRHQSATPNDPPIPTSATPNKGHVRRDGLSRSLPVG